MFSNLPVLRQIYSIICANLLTMSFGATMGWTSINFVNLQKADTTFPSGPLSLEQATRVVSIFFVSAVIGVLTLPHMARKFGNRTTIFALGIPQIISWLLIVFAQNPYYLYIARALAGLAAAGVMSLITLFASEICNDGVRGTLMSIFDPFANFGMVTAYLLGKYCDYADQAKFLMISTITFMILFAGVPESPAHLLKVNKQKAANKAHKFFTGREIESLPVTEDGKNMTEDSNVTLSDFTNPRARKALFIAFSLVLLSAVGGFSIVTAYISNIIQKSNPNISSIDAAIIISGMLIISNLTYSNLVHRAGRRVLFVSSALAASLGHAIFALYLFYLSDNHTYDWVPVVCLSYVLFVTCLGMQPVAWLMIVELLPKKIKLYAFYACILLALSSQFILSEIYPPILGHIGLVGWIVIFGSACLAIALFGIFVVPETRGKSHVEIMKLLD